MTELALEKQAREPIVLDLRGKVPYCDYFLICHGTSGRQVRAIASSMAEIMKRDHDHPTRAIEGTDAGRWVLLDFEDVIVHVFDEPVRSFYDLEGLWADAPRVALPDHLAERAEGTGALFSIP